jgi:hypothetical protein
MGRSRISRPSKQVLANKHALLREIVHLYLAVPREYPPVLSNENSCESEHLSVRLPMFIADAVRDRVARKGMSAIRWKACLVQSHLMREPVLSEKESRRCV